MSSSRIGNNRGGIVLQERDKHLLRELSIMRVIDRDQARVVAGFPSIMLANRRLLALARARLLKRFFIGTVLGGKKALYSLSLLGANLAQVPLSGPRRRNDEAVTVDFFVYHQLGINDIYCTLKYHPIADTRLVRWESFNRPIDSHLSLKPDAYLEVQSPQKTIAAFLEFDLGHENLVIWRAKIQKYLRYAVSGEFERGFHQPQFGVLAVTDSDRRCEALRKATAAITDKIFWFTTKDSIHREGFCSLIWLRPRGGPRGDHGPISLL